MPCHRPVPAFLAVLAIVASCASPEPPRADHVHRFTTTVTVTDGAILPAADFTIPAFSSVVWRNRGSAPLEVTIQAASCGTCETVLGFQPQPQGVRSVAIQPGAVASICFHTVGKFPFAAKVGDREQRGAITVAEAP